MAETVDDVMSRHCQMQKHFYEKYFYKKIKKIFFCENDLQGYPAHCIKASVRGTPMGRGRLFQLYQFFTLKG